jgi:hypothetical protein
MFGKIIINMSRKLKISLYLGTNFIFDKMLIIRDRGSKK